MKRFLLTMMVCLAAAHMLGAQTQQGIVRTLEKSNRPSRGIDGVSVQILDYRNTLVTKRGGKFSFSIPGKKQGDVIRVSRVTKKGYTLADPKGRKYAYSATVPIEIVMVSDKQLAADKKQIEEKAFARAKKTYETRIVELERQLAEKAISEQAYYAERERLSNDYDRYIQLIDEMAERYAMTDYKGLSDINRQILECIENAELERADSLINSKGDLDQREQELRSQMELNKATAEFLEQSQRDAEFKLNDLAQDYYNKYTILASRYENDSAAYWLERRAALDTTNVEWQNEAGLFIDEYLANYTLALEYYQRGLRQSLAQDGEQSEWTAASYNYIGNVYFSQSDYSLALEYYQKALSIWERVCGTDHPSIALSYNDIGLVCDRQGDSALALEYYQKALSILERVYGTDHPSIALSYNNIGLVYDSQGESTLALEYYQKALSIIERVYGCDHPDVALSYNNIGVVYDRKGDYVHALEYYLKSLSIRERVYGDDHPSIAQSFNNIGLIYVSQRNFEQALECFQKSMAIREHVYGDDHPSLATSYSGFAYVYYYQDDYVHALEYYQKALALQERAFGADHPDVALSYYNNGFAYYKLKDYAKSLECFTKAYNGYLKAFGSDHPNTQQVNSIVNYLKELLGQ